MTDMPKAAHAKPRDHLWVLVIIAICCLVKVWPSWVGIGAEAGFPDLGKIPTDWTLAVVIEAYWAYAVYAWLAAPAGKRSRLFAMWSAAGVFALSLVGQSATQVMAAKAVDVFANALPVLVLALIAILVHLRRHDRDADAAAERARAEDEQEARQASAEADQIAQLEDELEGALGELAPLRETLAEAKRAAEEANAARETAERKLAAQKANARRTKPANGTRRGKANGPAKAPANRVPDTEVPDDFDARAEALELYLANPEISGKELGEKVGLTARWGQLRKAEFAKAVAGTGPSDERS